MARLIAVLLAAAAGAACASHEAQQQTPQSPLDPCAHATPGAAWLAYATGESGSWDVLAMRADGTCTRTLASGPASDLDPAWAPSGIVAYASDRAPLPSVWVHEVETGAERRLDVGASLRASSPAFSPDGETLAFEGRYVGSLTSSIYRVPVGGGTPVELTPEATPHGNGGPAFSPDGATIYFVSNRTGVYDVFSVPAVGGPVIPVTTGSGIRGKPAISPDGTTLAFTRSAGSSTEVVLYDLGAATITPLGIAGASDPAFDPAGGRLLIRAPHGLQTTIDLVAVSGTGATRVTFGPGPDGAPAFAPLGH